MSSSDRPSSPWPVRKWAHLGREQPAAAKCATQLSHRASRPRTLTLHHSSTYRVHFSPARAVALRRARGSNFAGKTHERWGIHSSIGIQIRCHFSTSSSLNSPLTLPACAAAQVGVDFLHGEEWATSTSFSTEDFRIFDILFDLVELGTLRVKCAARARLPSLSVPPPCFCAPPQCRDAGMQPEPLITNP